MVSSPLLAAASGSRNRDGTGVPANHQSLPLGCRYCRLRLNESQPQFWPAETKFGGEAAPVRPCFGGTSHLLLGCDGKANSVDGLCRLHCCSPAGRCANGAGDTMPCCAFEYAEALDLSADRWAKMLVRRQEHDLEIIVALAAATPRGKGGFGPSANFRRGTHKNPDSEVHQSPGCPGVRPEQLRRLRIAMACARDHRLRRAPRRRGALPRNLLTRC